MGCPISGSVSLWEHLLILLFDEKMARALGVSTAELIEDVDERK
jgi:ABC-type Mn2+/Zn2+ transport system permease subunit